MGDRHDNAVGALCVLKVGQCYAVFVHGVAL